ncbi:hypothetical protein ABC383_17120 [Noviherbaspirillum sp. 1P10PC]|uniref:hypothetical protein n=1 Tax=Noviherbaspirillum sp. 1P10PC TaxID=3132292 RepID=UPI0039A32CAF
MQATIHSMQRIGRPACRAPAQSRKAMLPSPRTSVALGPHPVVRRCYSLDFSSGPDRPGGACNTVTTASAGNTDNTGNTAGMAGASVRTGPRPRASDLMPHQIQQLLMVSKGMACRVGQPVADIQAQLLMQASHDEPVAGPASLAPGKPGSARFADVVSLYDPDEEHRQEKLWLTRFFVQGREAVHARNMALNYTLISDRPWRLVLGGPDLGVISQERIRCAEIAFPGKCLVQLSLAKGMLHGFDGELAGTCAGLARQRYWGWFGHENRRCDEPGEHGWDANLLATIEPVRIAVIGDRAVAWSTLSQWQRTVPLEKTAEAAAWELARMSMPF